MPWTVIRKDFTHAASVVCALGCGRHITSGVAFVVQDENGNVGFAGSTCVRGTRNYDALIGTIPNFTSSTFIANLNAGAGGGNGGGGNAGGYAVDNRQIAITYLLLRFERLNHYGILRRTNTGMLSQIYARYLLDHDISDADVNYLLACANNITNHMRFNLRNLMAFYNLDNLCKIIGRSKHEKLLSQDKPDADLIAKALYTNTRAQPLDIQTINQILQRIESKYRMRTNAFQ